MTPLASTYSLSRSAILVFDPGLRLILQAERLRWLRGSRWFLLQELDGCWRSWGGGAVAQQTWWTVAGISLSKLGGKLHPIEEGEPVGEDRQRVCVALGRVQRPCMLVYLVQDDERPCSRRQTWFIIFSVCRAFLGGLIRC